ncbi:ArsR family transcriptional regulator [Desulfobulbus sp. F4]|nr:ArsR family transcriptional regulator [Desulfobulbus sp. F4]
MSQRQREVLKVLKSCGCCCSGRDIAAATSLGPNQISFQLTCLKKKGLVASPARCKYELTTAGKKLLL